MSEDADKLARRLISARIALEEVERRRYLPNGIGDPMEPERNYQAALAAVMRLELESGQISPA